MNNRPTPETDATAAHEGNWDTKALRMTAHARKLERERDEAREELEEYRSIAENIGAEKAISEKEKSIRERDEWAAMCGRYKQERDEAREQANYWESQYELEKGLYVIELK